MGRDLTKVSCRFNGKPLLIMTAHLESEKDSSKERKAQFHQVRVWPPYTKGYTKYAKSITAGRSWISGKICDRIIWCNSC